MPPSNIVGIDISLTGTGIAGRDWTKVVSSAGKNTDTIAMRHARICEMHAQIFVTASGTARLDLALIEQPAYSAKGGHAHDRSGLWWSVVEGLLDNNVKVVEVVPQVMKKYITGSGNADKFTVLRCIAQLFPWFTGGSDEADALGFCAMGYDHIGQPLVKLPAAQRKVLDSVKWND